MKNIQASNSDEENRSKTYTVYYDKKYDSGMVCECGYELIREDANYYQCTGGSHKYRIPKEGGLTYDVNGDPIFSLIKEDDEDTSSK
jgi:hypothetical protein